jgi:GTP-binding protein
MTADSRRDDPLVVRTVDYLGPMATRGGWRPESTHPEIAFAGRSNVGKSSLINTLVRRRKAARVSHTPGRTREIHFFAVNDLFTLVDLPGYGYARISKERRAEWKPLIEGYLTDTPALRGVVQLLDARRDPTVDDLDMLDFLAELGVPTIVVATKVDKLKTADRAVRLADLAKHAGMSEDQVVPFSAVTGEGRSDLAEATLALVTQPSWRDA